VLATFAVLFALVLVLTIAALQTDEALLRVAALAAIITSFLVMATVRETLTRGRSLGKLAVRLAREAELRRRLTVGR
jgi:hypothetical protein